MHTEFKASTNRTKINTSFKAGIKFKYGSNFETGNILKVCTNLKAYTNLKAGITDFIETVNRWRH